jgi:hypothetical protein
MWMTLFNGAKKSHQHVALDTINENHANEEDACDVEVDSDFDDIDLTEKSSDDELRGWMRCWCVGAHWYEVSPWRPGWTIAAMLLSAGLIVTGVLIDIAELWLSGCIAILLCLIAFQLEVNGWGSFKARLRTARLRRRQLAALRRLSLHERMQIVRECQAGGKSINDIKHHYGMSQQECDEIFPVQVNCTHK